MRLQTNSLAMNERLTKRLVIGFVAFAAAAIIGTVGMASAFQNHQVSHGYGGHQVGTNVNIDASHNRGVVHVVINYFFGS